MTGINTRQHVQKIPKQILKDSEHYKFYLKSFERYFPIKRNIYLNRKIKQINEDDIDICDCISSESLINVNSPRFKNFVKYEEHKLKEKWEKKLKKKQILEQKQKINTSLPSQQPLHATPPHPSQIVPNPDPFPSSLPKSTLFTQNPVESLITDIKNISMSNLPGDNDLLPSNKKYLRKIKFIYSKMRNQISEDFEQYIQSKITKKINMDPNVSIDCGSECFNKYISTECEAKTCPVGNLCNNRKFQRQENKLVYPKPTEDKGWGLFAMENIKKGDFIIQYLGEIFSVNTPIGLSRLREYSGSTCTYLMKLSQKEVIDPTYKGNVARFINHSCDPNCITQKWNVLGEVFVGIFAKKDIYKNQELTFDYKFDVYKTPFLECFCGAENCKGFLGLAGPRPTLNDPSDTKVCIKLDKLAKYYNNQIDPIELNETNDPLYIPKENKIELQSNKKDNSKGSFILKKTNYKKLKLDESDDSEEIKDDFKKKLDKRYKKKLETELISDVEDDDNEKDFCEICRNIIELESDSDSGAEFIPSETTKNKILNEKNENKSAIPCPFCPTYYHLKCISFDKCIKCENCLEIEPSKLINSDLNPQKKISFVSSHLDKNDKSSPSKIYRKGREYTKKASNDNISIVNESIDSDDIDMRSVSQNINPSTIRQRKNSISSRTYRKDSETLSNLGRSGNKNDFRNKKKQQFKIINDQIVTIFDKQFPTSEFFQKYFDSKNKLKDYIFDKSNPPTDYYNFLISPIELAVFKSRGTRIFLKQTNIFVFWNNSDLSLKNIFAKNSELRFNCKPKEKEFVNDLLKFIKNCVINYRENSGTIENSFQVPAIFLKRVLGEYYFNSKFVQRNFSVKLTFERAFITDECYPIHLMTNIRLRGRSDNIKKAHEYIVNQLRPLVARRKYMTRDDIKIIISKLSQIKKNINPTEIRCCRDNALRDINHAFYTIYYKDKEVALIGTKEEVIKAENFVNKIIESNRKLEDNSLSLNFLAPGNGKQDLIQIKTKVEKKFSNNELIIYDSLPPKKDSSLTIISTYKRFPEFYKFVKKEIDSSKICIKLFEDFQKEQIFQKSKSYLRNLMNFSLTQSLTFIKSWDCVSSEFGNNSVHFSSLYKELQKRILEDFEFQFFLLFVNKIIKNPETRKEMGLSNSIVLKILIIMLYRENKDYSNKSIFDKSDLNESSVKQSKKTLTSQLPENLLHSSSPTNIFSTKKEFIPFPKKRQNDKHSNSSTKKDKKTIDNSFLLENPFYNEGLSVYPTKNYTPMQQSKQVMPKKKHKPVEIYQKNIASNILFQPSSIPSADYIDPDHRELMIIQEIEKEKILKKQMEAQNVILEKLNIIPTKEENKIEVPNKEEDDKKKIKQVEKNQEEQEDIKEVKEVKIIEPEVDHQYEYIEEKGAKPNNDFIIANLIGEPVVSSVKNERIKQKLLENVKQNKIGSLLQKRSYSISQKDSVGENSCIRSKSIISSSSSSLEDNSLSNKKDNFDLDPKKWKFKFKHSFSKKKKKIKKTSKKRKKKDRKKKKESDSSKEDEDTKRNEDNQTPKWKNKLKSESNSDENKSSIIKLTSSSENYEKNIKKKNETEEIESSDEGEILDKEFLKNLNKKNKKKKKTKRIKKKKKKGKCL